MASDIQNASLPHRGQLVPDYSFTTADGRTISLTDFRNKQNVVLMFCHTPMAQGEAKLVQELAAQCALLRENETRVLAVTSDLEPTLQANSSAVELVHRDAPVTAAEQPTTIYITDKFREIFHVYRITTSEKLPTADDVLGWVKFVAMNCPECHPPEWPADAL